VTVDKQETSPPSSIPGFQEDAELGAANGLTSTLQPYNDNAECERSENLW